MLFRKYTSTFYSSVTAMNDKNQSFTALEILGAAIPSKKKAASIYYYVTLGKNQATQATYSSLLTHKGCTISSN